MQDDSLTGLSFNLNLTAFKISCILVGMPHAYGYFFVLFFYCNDQLDLLSTVP